ncbi:MAG: PAS domain S-box protein [Anaerolineaceae bacterium]|nr:PAS domain S-box protein [Anaerolineaceae bacterium]
MDSSLSPQLQKRLERIAQAQGCSLEALLCTYADQVEGSSAAQPTKRTFEESERILNAIFDGYLLGDLTGRILDANQVYCEMVGYSREELLQKTVFDLNVATPTTQSEQMQEFAEQIIRDDISIITEVCHRHKDGHILNIEVNSIRFKDGRIASFMRDITERKRLEHQHHLSEQLYRGLIESQIDLVCRYTPDTVLTYSNDAYGRFFDKRPEAIVGKSFLALNPDSETESIMVRIRQVLENPAPDVRVFHMRSANGEKRWIQWIDYGIMDETGKVVEIQAVGRDITPLIEAQQKLAKREEMLSTILENIPVLVAQLDEHRRSEYVNRQWEDVLGWSLDEVHTHPDILSEFYPDPAARQRALDYITAADGEWYDFKTHTRSGEVLDMSWANMRLSDGQQLSIGQVMSHRVELENQRIYALHLETELEKEREMREIKDRFISLMSHEFRTPLSVMNTSIDLVTHYLDRLPPERVLEKLGTIQQQIGRMVDLMEDALRFNKSQAGKTPFAPQEIDICPFCQSVIETLKVADNHQHEFIITGDTGLVRADSELLDHIFAKLLVNALRYSPDHTDIHITITQKSDFWIFHIQDEGIGIPEEDIPRVFEPFFRGRNVRNYSGTGLGLSIVKEYVEMHGGQIAVMSEVGTGTTFTFTLPV